MVDDRRGDRFLRLTAGAIACADLALSLSLAITRWLPVGDEARWALGTFLPLPLWVTLACVVARAGSGARAWAMCGGAIVLVQIALRCHP